MCEHPRKKCPPARVPKSIESTAVDAVKDASAKTSEFHAMNVAEVSNARNSILER